MEMKNDKLLQPLLPPPTNQSNLISTNSDITLRLLAVAIIGILSIWANHESSRFFDITIINDYRDTPSGKLFNLKYVSNDKASNLILEASRSIGRLLYNETHLTLLKKLINHVTLTAVDDGSATDLVTVDLGSDDGGYRHFAIKVSLSVMEKDARMGVEYAVRKGVARVWLWDSIAESSSELMEGVIEYVAAPSSGVGGDEVGRDYPAMDGKNARVVADLLRWCERRNEGFVRRLVNRWRQGEELLQRCKDAVKNDAKKTGKV